MTADAATGVGRGRPGHQVVASVARAIAGGTALALTIAWGYYYTFSRFFWYDDEGYVMMSVRQVAEGRALYDDVYSQYGPFYYVMRLALLSTFQAPVSHDVTRLITVGTWLAAALLVGLYLIRVGRVGVAVLIGYLLVFHHLRPMAHEPGHPQELCVLMLASLVAVAAWCNAPRRASDLMIFSGVVVGGLTLTKINVGVYALLALAIAIATFAPRARAALLTLVALASVALPWLVMREHLGWSSGYAAVVSLGSLAVVVACHGVQSERPLGPSVVLRFVVAAVATTFVTCLVMFVRGTSATGLVNGVLLQPLAFAGIFFTEVRIGGHAVVAAGVSLMAAFVYVSLPKAERSEPTTGRWVFWWLKLAAGLLGIYLAVKLPQALLALGPALVWLVLVRPFGEPWRYEQWLPRVVLANVAALQTLQAYPVAGSQVSWATFLMIPTMVLCAVDAIADLSATRARHLIKEAPVARSVLGTAAVVGVLVVYAAQADVVGARRRYQAFSPLSLPGSQRVRLSADEVARYRWLVDRVHRHCETIITLPGLNSLYFWTEQKPPTGFNTTAWPVLFGRNEQQHIVDVVRSRQKVCVVEYAEGIRTFGRDAVISQQPLMRFVRDEFQVIEERDGYRVMSRRATAGAGS